MFYTRPTRLHFCSASLVKHQMSTDRHVAPLGLKYPDSEPTFLCSYTLMFMFNLEATNTNFILPSLMHQTEYEAVSVLSMRLYFS